MVEGDRLGSLNRKKGGLVGLCGKKKKSNSNAEGRVGVGKRRVSFCGRGTTGCSSQATPRPRRSTPAIRVTSPPNGLSTCVFFSTQLLICGTLVPHPILATPPDRRCDIQRRRRTESSLQNKSGRTVARGCKSQLQSPAHKEVFFGSTTHQRR